MASSVPTEKGSLLNQLCTANELLPSVVWDDCCWLDTGLSQARGDADVPTTSSQPASGVKHQRVRVSVEE